MWQASERMSACRGHLLDSPAHTNNLVKSPNQLPLVGALPTALAILDVALEPGAAGAVVQRSSGKRQYQVRFGPRPTCNCKVGIKAIPYDHVLAAIFKQRRLTEEGLKSAAIQLAAATALAVNPGNHILRGSVAAVVIVFKKNAVAVAFPTHTGSLCYSMKDAWRALQGLPDTPEHWGPGDVARKTVRDTSLPAPPRSRPPPPHPSLADVAATACLFALPAGQCAASC